MAFASRQAVMAARGANQQQDWVFGKTGTLTPEAAFQHVDFATMAGTPGAMANPTTYANCTDLAGTMTFTNKSPANRYLTGYDLLATQDCTLYLFDLLGHIGSISTATTGNKTVSSSALPRSMSTNDLLNVEAWVRVTAATDAVAPIISMNSYTNEAGTTGRAGATLTFPAAATNIGWMGKLPLQAGDKGVQAISTINVATDSDTVGTITVALMRQIACVGLEAGKARRRDLDNLKRIYDGSCLVMVAMASAASAFNVSGTWEFTYDS